MARNANRMQEAVDRLKERFEQCASVTVTYSHGTTVISNISATVGRTPFQIVEGEVIITRESRDYMIKKADLVTAGGVQLVPASGGRITEASGAVYIVSVPKPNNVFESIGPAGSVYKIHTVGQQ